MVERGVALDAGSHQAWDLHQRVADLAAARRRYGARADEVARLFFVGDETWPLADAPTTVTPPPWLDVARCHRGGLALRRHGVLTATVLRSMSLPLSYTSAIGVRPLVATGELVHDAPERLYRTADFVRTTQQAHAMSVGGEGWRAAASVRTIHQRVRLHLRRAGWPTHWGTPLPQPDVAATALLFGPVLVTGLRRLGAQIDEVEADDVAHLARAIAHGQGVLPSLQADRHREGMELFALITALNHGPEAPSRALMNALLDIPNRLALSPADRLVATVVRSFYGGLSRHLLGPDTSRALGIEYPDTWGRLLQKAAQPWLAHPRFAHVHDRLVDAVMARGRRRLSQLRRRPIPRKPTSCTPDFLSSSA